MNKKATRGQLFSIVQWIILWGLGFGLYFGLGLWFSWLFPITMFLIHSAEAICYGIPRGKINGYTALESLCLTWLYGFTWWKNLPKSDVTTEKSEISE